MILTAYWSFGALLESDPRRPLSMRYKESLQAMQEMKE